MLPNKAESFSLCWKGAWVSEGRSLRLSVGQFVCLSPLPVLSLLFETMINEIWKCIIAKQEFLCKAYTVKKQSNYDTKQKEAQVPMSPDNLKEVNAVCLFLLTYKTSVGMMYYNDGCYPQ